MSVPANANSFFNVSENLLTSYHKGMYRESVQMFGYDCKYIPIDFTSGDINYIFGEVPKISYTKIFDIRMFMDEYDEIHEAIASFSKFGFMVAPDNITVTVSKTDYDLIIKDNGTVIPPKSGDLILVTIHAESVLFEVTHITYKYDSYYLMNVKLYNYDSMTTIDTGNQLVDSVNDSDYINLDFNKEIEDANEEYQDHNARHSVFGEY